MGFPLQLPFFPCLCCPHCLKTDICIQDLCKTCVFPFNSSSYTHKLMGSLFHSSSSFLEVFLSKDHHMYEIIYICIHTHTPLHLPCVLLPLTPQGMTDSQFLFSPLPGLPSLPLYLWLLNIPLSSNPPAILASTADFNYENPLKQSAGWVGQSSCCTLTQKLFPGVGKHLYVQWAWWESRRQRSYSSSLPQLASTGKRERWPGSKADLRKKEYSFCRFSQYSLPLPSLRAEKSCSS